MPAISPELLKELRDTANLRAHVRVVEGLGFRTYRAMFPREWRRSRDVHHYQVAMRKAGLKPETQRIRTGDVA